MKKILRPLLAFLLLGIIKLLPEQKVTHYLRAEGVLGQRLDFGLRENLGQMGFAASLGGLRSLVASITYLQAFSAFERVDWAQVDSLLSLTTSLQPRLDLYWEDATNRMAYDAASYYEHDSSRPELYRLNLYNQNVARGLELVNRGLVFNPDSRRLHELAARLYESRLRPPDYRLAAQHYRDAFVNGGLPFTARFAAYNLMKLNEPAADELAYKYLKTSYDLGSRSPTHLKNLRILEQRLNIPSPQRIRDDPQK
jgi:hypothetical protein